MKNPFETSHGERSRSEQTQQGECGKPPKAGDAVLDQQPRPEDLDTLALLQATIAKVALNIEDRREAFFANPQDISTIHRFRTNIRTLRSLFAFVKPWQNAHQNREIQAILKQVVAYTSRQRELDVLEKQVRANPDSSPELRAFCSKEASAERADVLGILASKRTTESFERAMSLSKHVVWRKRYATSGLPERVARARFDAMVESFGIDLAALDLHDPEQTHDVRKRAKRVRYVAEHNEDILGADAVVIAGSMTAHQDNLGDICDARANIRLIDEFLQRNPSENVAQELSLMRAQNVAFLRDALRS